MAQAWTDQPPVWQEVTPVPAEPAEPGLADKAVQAMQNGSDKARDSVERASGVDQVLAELVRREGTSGLAEKAARS